MKMPLTTEEMIKPWVDAVGARRHERPEQVIFAGGQRIVVKKAGQKVLTLPNGQRVMMETSDGGHTTQVHEDHALPAVVRPAMVGHFKFPARKD